MTKPLLVVLLAVLITTPLMMPEAIAQGSNGEASQAPDDWEPWLDEDLIVRVPLEVTLGDNYPPEWSGPRLVVEEVDVHATLDQAGWPMDLGQPIGFTPDPDSFRVVPQGVDDPEPLPMITWPGALFSSSTTGPTTTLAFLADEEVRDYHVYFDRLEDEDEHEPVPRDPIVEQQILQLLTGQGSGHELVAPFQGSDITVAIGSAHQARITVEQRTPQGTNVLGCSTDTIGPGQWAECTRVRAVGDHDVLHITADRPVVAYAWDDASGTPLIPLASEKGTPQGQTLLAPDVHEPTTVHLIGVQDTCQATAGPTTRQVSPDTPTSLEIHTHQAIEAECDILGWIAGRGPAPLPTAINATITKAALTQTAQDGSCERQIATAVGDQGTRTVRVHTAVQEDDFRVLSRPVAEPQRADHDGLRGADWLPLDGGEGDGYTLANQGGSVWYSLWDDAPGVMQLAPTPTGSIGWIGPEESNTQDCSNEVRLATVPFQPASPRVEFAVHGERIPPDTLLDTPALITKPITHAETPSENTQIPSTGTLAETGIRGAPLLAAGFAIVGDGAIPSAFAAHLAPVQVDTGEPDVIGPLFDLELDPSARISPPGEVQTFTLLGSGRFQAPTGEVTPLEINLNAESTTLPETAPSAEHDLGDVQAELPLDDPEPITTLTVTVPSDVPPDTTYRMLVTGEPVEGGDAIPARSTVQVVADREIHLAFEDGSQFSDLSTEDGEAHASLLLSNDGTVEENVELSTFVPGNLGWDVTLIDPATNEPFPGDVVQGLEPNDETPIELSINVPGDASRVVDVDIIARSEDDASVTSEATARIAHGIDVNVAGSVSPDLVSLEPGENRDVNLTLENQGSEASVRVLTETEDQMTLEAEETRVNLGPEGSQRANATLPINVTAAPDALIGSVVVGTITLEVSVGGLDPIEHLLSLRLRIVPAHGVDALETIELLPGIETSTNLTVQSTGDADEDLAISMRSAPQGWTVEHPARLNVPHNETAPLLLNITTPSGTSAGTYDLIVRGTPSDGTDTILFPVQTAVPESAAFHLTLPSPPALGLGVTETYPLTVENRGNAEGNATLEAESSIAEALPQPAALTLAPGEEHTIDLDLTATETGNGTVTVTADPGMEASFPMDVGLVDLQLEVVSATTPTPGEAYQAAVSLTNEGTVQARDVDVVLTSEGERLHSERVTRLDPGAQVTMTVGLNELPSAEGLRLTADPDGSYEQANPADRQVDLSPDEAPLPSLAFLLPLLGLLAVALRRDRP